MDKSPSSRRAWIEIAILPFLCVMNASPSSRRAWIEILFLRITSFFSPSPSSRRAWIEMVLHNGFEPMYVRVALLAEGVDRNVTLSRPEIPADGRPPRGGRG